MTAGVRVRVNLMDTGVFLWCRAAADPFLPRSKETGRWGLLPKSQFSP